MISLQRFTNAQERYFLQALSEIKKGRKQSHWMWFIFPQIAGLGYSETSRHYAIKDSKEAKAYLEHPLLGGRLIQICEALLQLRGSDAYAIFGTPDDVKLKSSMTLFSLMPDAPPVFQAVLDKFFGGVKDARTIGLLDNWQDLPN